MSLSPSTAQSREISELRNHLKWIDEERRKATRKMTDLEQKLAQQGRELVEREQRIQDLEWHITHLTERLDQISDPAALQATVDSRLAEMEGQLSGNVAQLDRRITGFQDSIANLTSQLRERTVSLAAESQTNLNSLATRLQERVETRIATSESNVAEMVQAQVAASEAKLSELIVARVVANEEKLLDVVNAQTVANEEKLLALVNAQAVTSEEKLLALVNAQTLAGEEKLAEMLSAQLTANEEKLTELIGARLAESETKISELMNVQTAANAERLAEEANLRAATEVKVLDLVNAQVAADQAKVSELIRVQIEASEQKLADHFATQLATTQSRLDDLNDLSTEVKTQVEAQIAETQSSLITQMQERVDALLIDTEAKIAQVQEGINKMGNARELMVLITKMENDLELREAEEIRLANLISEQETRLAPYATNFEAVQERTAMLNERLAEAEELVAQLQKAVHDYTENGKPLLMETNRRLSPLHERLTTLNNNFLKVEATLQSLTGDQVDIREAIANLADEIHQSHNTVAGQIETWQTTLDEQKDTVERFSQQWIGLSTQYKEARMAVQNLAHWQKQLEQQKREASEMLRVESNRMQSRWDGFMQEVQDKLKAFELDLAQKIHAIELENEQKWSNTRRSEQLWREEIASIEELILKLQQDNRNMLLRVQTAQANAIKKWPRLLMEEVEKVVDTNPNRRLPSASTSTARSEISVADAIEQGLITVDYSDDMNVDSES